jgi:flagellar biosynthesis protein FlhB
MEGCCDEEVREVMTQVGQLQFVVVLSLLLILQIDLALQRQRFELHQQQLGECPLFSIGSVDRI